MSDNRVKFLLSKEYLNIKDIREVLLLNEIDLSIEEIIDWLKQCDELYSKAGELIETQLLLTEDKSENSNKVEIEEGLRQLKNEKKYDLDFKTIIYNEYINLLHTKSSFIKEYLNSLQDLQPKLTTNQDNSYQYSQALKPYNDIILAFADSDDYIKYGDNTKPTKHIIPWLNSDYKDKELINGDDVRVLNKLIQSHYKLN